MFFIQNIVKYKKKLTAKAIDAKRNQICNNIQQSWRSDLDLSTILPKENLVSQVRLNTLTYKEASVFRVSKTYVKCKGFLFHFIFSSNYYT